MRRYSRLLAVALAAALASSTSQSSWAQTDAEVAGARKLFAEGVKDEDRRDFENALEKFRKVQTVKDTASVRYRIANCLDNLGHLKDAVASYRGAIELAESDTATQQGQADVARAAREKLTSLEKRAPALTLTLTSRAPSDTVVEIDGKPIASAELGRPVVLDPGNHRVTAHGTGATPFETQVALPDGARFSLVIPLDRNAVAAAPVDAGVAPAPTTTAPPPPDTSSSSSSSTAGWVLVGGGAALIVGSGVTWLVRQNAIGTMNDNCPNNRCPLSTQEEVTSAKSRAQTMVPLTIVLAAAGAAAAGTGAFLLVRSRNSTESTTTPTTLRVRPTVALGSGAVFIEGSF